MQLGAKYMGGIMKDKGKDANNYGSDKMVSKGGLDLRYRPVNSRDINWN